MFENNLRLAYDPISLPSPPRGYIVEDQAADGDIGNGFTSFRDVIASEGQLGGVSNSTTHIFANAWTPDTSVLSALESVVPQPVVDESLHGFPLTLLDIRVFTSPLHRQILCSMANNFAGLDGLPIQDIIHFLQKESNEKLYRTVRSAQGYTARAIIQSIFKAAVEVGDAGVVDILVRENPADIKINERSCIVDGTKYTPIEKAIQLQHEELVEIFLSHGVEVNGALDLAAKVSPRESWANEAIPCHHRIFRKLLEKGGQLGESTLIDLVIKNGELAVLIISAQARKNAVQWCRWGVFSAAIMFLDDHLSMKIIEIMLECGVDLNHDVDERSSRMYDNYSYRVVDMAAQRGQLPIVDLLLKSGASLTGNTLPCAVKSQNRDLIRLLLESGADINSIGSLEITTLSVAIELRDDDMIRFLEDQGAVINHSEEHCSAAVRAAFQAGNIQLIERLIQLRGRVSPEDLGCALLIATIDGRDEDVEKLIDAGADVDCYYCNSFESKGPPLYEVLKQRKESLALSLLNADADPDCFNAPFHLAVEWGNRSVIKAFIFAGVDVNRYEDKDTALTIAVKRHDLELLKLLLASGAEINKTPTPLEAAAEMGDKDMAQYLINQGADPNDSRALEWSFEKNQELFDLLCQTYRKRYSSTPGIFGTSILMNTIESENHDAIKLMLQSGVNPEAMSRPKADRSGLGTDLFCRFWGSLQKISALGYAIVRQKENITEDLLQQGCDPNGIVLEVYGYREPAIVAAIGTQKLSMVELLINYRAKVNFPTFRSIRRTPLQKAAEVGDIKIVTLLINNGADVNAPAAHAGGGTSLQLAAIGGYISVACRLLNHKADVNAPGSKINGRTALEGAAEHGRLDMIRLLLNAGAGSRHGDEGQVANAIALARENQFYYICDLLESHFHRREGQDSGPEILLDDSHDDLREWNLEEDPFPF